jgi:hypothetical protein
MAITSSTGDAGTEEPRPGPAPPERRREASGRAEGRPARSAAAPLARYLAAATLARGADAGAPVGLALLATSSPAGPAAGGLLAAALTAPHLLGPWVARRLDAARDGRRVLAATFAGYGVALAAGAFLVGRAPLALAGAAVVLAGLCGPLLTGGMSSRLAATAGEGREGWDALSYGLGGTGGPALVALATAVTTPLSAVLALAAAAGLGALLALTLPRTESAGAPPPARACAGLLVRNGPLRRVNLLTLLPAFGTGGLAVIAAVLGSASLVAAFGLGNLAGSLLVTALPPRGEPERAARLGALGLAAALGLGAAAPSLATFALAGLANAPFFTATLAARARYAPEAARAQVFVAMAGLKVAAASAGAAVAGAAVAAAGPRGLLAVGAAITFAAILLSLADRRLERCPSSPKPSAPGSRSSASSIARSSRSTTATRTSAAPTRLARSPRRSSAGG